MKVQILGLRLIVICTLILGTSAKAQSFKVRVLDALNGKPYSDVPIIYYCDDPAQPQRTWNRAVTDASGYAVIPYECGAGKRIKVDTFLAMGESSWGVKIAECGWLEPQTIEHIINDGVISNPSAAGGIWCPTRVSKRLTPIPGQVIIFVKKPTWWQTHVAP